PGASRAAEGQAVYRLRGEPARLDQPDPRGPGPGPRPRPALRRPERRLRPGPRRPPPPNRPELHGPGRGGHAGHDPGAADCGRGRAACRGGQPSRSRGGSRARPAGRQRAGGTRCVRGARRGVGMTWSVDTINSTGTGTGRGRTPARPGPGPTPEALLRALDLTVGRRIRGLLPGEYRAHDLGGGTELAQVRPYEPGDDVRRIDWNV